MDDGYDEDDREQQVRRALVTGLAVLAGIAVAIALGTVVMVRALGLDAGDDTGPVGAPSSPRDPLPTRALEVPGGSPSPSDLVTPDEAAESGAIQLAVSPVISRPMERINLTGIYPGMDNVGLQVQRQENGRWEDFGVQATVRVGTFETYVMTGRPGDNRFRMYDPQAGEASNVVVVTVE